MIYGKINGLHTLLMLSGATDIDTMQEWERSEDAEEQLRAPEYYLEDVNELYKLIKNF